VYPDTLDRIAYKKYNGTSWSTSELAKGSTKDAPAVCVYRNDKMYVIYNDEDANVYVTDFDGSVWSTVRCITDINGAQTHDALAAHVDYDRITNGSWGIDVILRSPDPNDNGRMYMFTIRQDGHISGLEIIPQGSTSDGVGIFDYGSMTVMIYQNGGTGNSWGGDYYIQKR